MHRDIFGHIETFKECSTSMTSFVAPFEQVSLHPLDDISVDQYRTWQNDPMIRDMTLGFRFPVQDEAVNGWMRARVQGNGQREVGFSIFYQGTGVGACFLRNIDWVNQTGEFGLYLDGSSARGRGVGYCSSVLLLDYAFKGLNLRRISSEILALNSASIRLFERLGFQQEGVARGQVLLGGQARDVVRFGILVGEFSKDVPPEARRLIAL